MKTAILTLCVLCVFAWSLPAQTPTMRDLTPYTTEEVFQAVLSKDRQYQKDEFEKRDDYLARLAKLNAETRVSLVKTDPRTLDGAVFVFHNLATYDAENEVFTFSMFKIFSNGTRYEGATGNLDYLLTPARLMSSGTWLGDASNVLTLTPPRVRMSPDKARDAAPSLALAIYAMPVGVNVNVRRLLVVPTRMVAFNQATGEIYDETHVR